MTKKKDSREKIFVPKMGWLSGDKFSDHGNTFTGSVDAVSLSFNAFCYKITVTTERDKEHFMTVSSYDVITKNQPESYKTEQFPLTEEGREQAHAWLIERYEEYLDADRDEIPVSFK